MADKATTTKPLSTSPDTSTWEKAGRNIRFTTLDKFLFIAVPIDDATINASPKSASAKSISVGTTNGNVPIPGTALKMGVNVYTPVTSAA